MKKVSRTTISVPQDLLAEIDREAKEQGRNRSSYLTWLAMQYLKKLRDNEFKLTGESSDITK